MGGQEVALLRQALKPDQWVKKIMLDPRNKVGKFQLTSLHSEQHYHTLLPTHPPVMYQAMVRLPPALAYPTPSHLPVMYQAATNTGIPSHPPVMYQAMVRLPPALADVRVEGFTELSWGVDARERL